MTTTKQDGILTIGITSYDYGRYIFDAIESVINQTSTRWKLMICDNGSTDWYIKQSPSPNYVKVFRAALSSRTAGTAPNDGDFLANIDYTMDVSFDAWAEFSTRPNAVEEQREINDCSQFSMTTILSLIEDLDYVDAIPQLNQKTMG